MIIISDTIKENIVTVLRTVAALANYIEKHEDLNLDQLQHISLCSAELALLSLAAADELDAMGEPVEQMIRHELASALKQIAIHFLNIQEWENSDNIRAFFASITRHCGFIADTLGFCEEPQSLETEEMQLMLAIEQLNEDSTDIAVREDNASAADKLKAEIKALREILIALVMERDHLLNVVCKEIESQYMRELGTIEAEIYHAECEIRYLRRKLEMMRAALNRRESINVEKIHTELKGQYEEYQKVYEEFVRRINEAATFQNERNNTADTTNEKEPESKDKTLKKLYRKIVKAMHPDINPNQTDAEKELFKRAVSAYEAGDLKTLNEIASMLDGEMPGAGDDAVEALLQEKNRLLALIQAVKTEIKSIKTRYPYTKKEILDDPGKLAAEKATLKNKLDQAMQIIEAYKNHIAEMVNNNGRSDTTTE